MFRLIEPSSGQIQNPVQVHSVSAHIMGSNTVYRSILTISQVNFVSLPFTSTSIISNLRQSIVPCNRCNF